MISSTQAQKTSSDANGGMLSKRRRRITESSVQTATSMSPMLIHENVSIFPNHCEFEPERWLQNDKDLGKFLVAFGKGPRICLGINLDPFLSAASLQTKSHHLQSGVRGTVCRTCNRVP